MSFAHDELVCAVDAAVMYRSILRASGPAYGPVDVAAAVAELRERLPVMYATLSPGARALICDHLAHFEDLVAALHKAILTAT